MWKLRQAVTRKHARQKRQQTVGKKVRIARRPIRKLDLAPPITFAGLSCAMFLRLTRHVCEGVTRCDARHARHRACTHRQHRAQTALRERREREAAWLPLPLLVCSQTCPSPSLSPLCPVILTCQRVDGHHGKSIGCGGVRQTDSDKQTPVSRPRQTAGRADQQGDRAAATKQQQTQRTARHAADSQKEKKKRQKRKKNKCHRSVKFASALYFYQASLFCLNMIKSMTKLRVVISQFLCLCDFRRGSLCAHRPVHCDRTVGVTMWCAVLLRAVCVFLESFDRAGSPARTAQRHWDSGRRFDSIRFDAVHGGRPVGGSCGW